MKTPRCCRGLSILFDSIDDIVTHLLDTEDLYTYETVEHLPYTLHDYDVNSCVFYTTVFFVHDLHHMWLNIRCTFPMTPTILRSSKLMRLMTSTLWE